MRKTNPSFDKRIGSLLEKLYEAVRNGLVDIPDDLVQSLPGMCFTARFSFASATY